MRRSRKFASILTVGILALGATACGDDSDSGDDDSTGGTTESSSTSESSDAAPASDIKVGMAYDVGGRGDQSFNDSAAAGLDQAADELGVESEESEASDGEAESAREERLITFAEAGFDPIIAVGFAYAESVGKVAEQYPDVHFAIIDDSSLADVPNVASLVFAEEQGSFLVGAAAALKSDGGPHRLRRWRPGAADREVPGRLRGGRQGGQPGHQGRCHLPDPAPGLLRLR